MLRVRLVGLDLPSRQVATGRAVGTGIVARLRVGRNAGRLRNSIVADAAQRDPAAANNRDRSALAPTLTLRKTGNARNGREGGDKLTYTLRLRNGGPGGARNVVLCDRPGPAWRCGRAPKGACGEVWHAGPFAGWPEAAPFAAG